MRTWLAENSPLLIRRLICEITGHFPWGYVGWRDGKRWELDAGIAEIHVCGYCGTERDWYVGPPELAHMDAEPEPISRWLR